MHQSAQPDQPRVPGALPVPLLHWSMRSVGVGSHVFNVTFENPEFTVNRLQKQKPILRWCPA